MPSTYLIADVDVHDVAAFEKYRNLSSIAMQAHGAELYIRGRPIEVLEGDWHPKSVVVLKFASTEAARRFWDSPEYRKAREAREKVSTMQVVMMEEDM